MTDEQPPHQPFAEEATRLLGMLQEWTRQTFPAAPAGVAEHQAAPVCEWCPLCQFMAVLRGDRPEVTARVAEAGTAITTALRSVLDAATSAAPHPQPPEPAPRVQRIDLGTGPDSA